MQVNNSALKCKIVRSFCFKMCRARFHWLEFSAFSKKDFDKSLLAFRLSSLWREAAPRSRSLLPLVQQLLALAARGTRLLPDTTSVSAARRSSLVM